MLRPYVRLLILAVFGLPLVMVGCTCSHQPTQPQSTAEDQLTPIPPDENSSSDNPPAVDEDDDIPPPEAPMDHDGADTPVPSNEKTTSQHK